MKHMKQAVPHIKVVGLPCPKIDRTLVNAQAAAAEFDDRPEVSWIGDIHHIVEGTLGFWHKFYNGPKGRVQWGLQYSYLTKYGWSGNNFNFATGTAGPSLRPHAVDNMFWTSFRYYLP